MLFLPFPKSVTRLNKLIFMTIQKHTQIATDAGGGAAGEFRANLARLLVMISPLF